jgi:selT/selW/selH-like putative selenoprotein
VPLVIAGGLDGSGTADDLRIRTLFGQPETIGDRGTFAVRVDGHLLWDRKTVGRFPEMKELKQCLRDAIAPERDLGHSDTAERQE